jgi:putative hydrolase of HD superfamily
VLEFLLGFAGVKLIPRSGWISHGISLQDIESVADHSFSTCALSLLIADMEVERGQQLDIERVLRMAILHDLSESLTFDISKQYLEYLGEKGEAIKEELEHAAWKQIAKNLKSLKLRRNYLALQREFDAERSKEAKIAHAADRLDLLLQVIQYRRKGYPAALLADLWNGTNKKLRSSDIASVLKIQKVLIREGRRLGARNVK